MHTNHTFKNIGIALMATALFMPFITSAQAVNTSATIQQSFLSQLQSLEQELAALQSTIAAMITAAGGIMPQMSSSTSAVAPTVRAIPNISSTLSITTPNLSGTDLSSALLAAIAPSTTTVSVAASAAATSVTPVAIIKASQMDPSCVSGLFGNNAQCGGLYYCSIGIQNPANYWSPVSCPSEE